MQARARVRFLRMSPKKMRRVANLIKGKPVEEALNILNFTPKIAAHHLAKTVKAAAANAISNVGTAKLKAEDLSISKVMVDGGPIAPRVRFQSMGRAHRIRKRFCHLTVEVEGEPEPETAKSKGASRKKAQTTKPDSTEKKARAGAKKTAAKAKKDKAEAVEEKTKPAGKKAEAKEADARLIKKAASKKAPAEEKPAETDSGTNEEKKQDE